MDNKGRSKHKLSGRTQFILVISVRDAFEKLTGFPQLHLNALHAEGEKYDLEVSFLDDSSNQKVYLSMRSWNQTDTFVTILPNRPISPLLMVTLVLTVTVTLIVLSAFQSFLALGLIALIIFVFGMYNYHNYAETIFPSKTKAIDSKSHAKQKLINTIVEILTDNAEVQLINT